jgi:hypothetical protein
MKKARNGFAKNLHYLCLTGVIALGFMTIIATGGGGGGGGGGGAPAISYTGLTDPAPIDENNAEDLTVGAITGYSVGSEIGLGSVQSDEYGGIEHPLTLRLPEVLKEALYQLDIPSHIGAAPFGAIECESGSFDGDCGGSAYGRICLDNVSGAFDGYIKFYSYCSEGVTISGRVDISGIVLDIHTYDFLQLSMSFNNVTAASGGYSCTLAGTIAYDFTPPISVTMDMRYRNNSTEKVYWVADYAIILTEMGSYVAVEISGRFYDPDYGYVEIYTEDPLQFYYSDVWPSDGVLIATGETGSEGGPTMARLTVLDSTTYKVEADTNGDGIYDWVSDTLYW